MDNNAELLNTEEPRKKIKLLILGAPGVGKY